MLISTCRWSLQGTYLNFRFLRFCKCYFSSKAISWVDVWLPVCRKNSCLTSLIVMQNDQKYVAHGHTAMVAGLGRCYSNHHHKTLACYLLVLYLCLKCMHFLGLLACFNSLQHDYILMYTNKIKTQIHT